tara:strand:- start:234 stop:344 length:111 start_codon:yes stop_codon:yes gene_type:complete
VKTKEKSKVKKVKKINMKRTNRSDEEQLKPKIIFDL